VTTAKLLKSIAVVTPGGDAPGMNTAIRSVVRTAIYHGLKVWGIEKGWFGLINGLIIEMGPKSVGGIINKGGTILHTRRCPEFRDKKNMEKGYKELKSRSIDALIVIGGDGSMHAAHGFSKRFGVPANFIPATIDNDIPGTDFTIGFDTAVNTALDAIDKIRDTATSHERLFLVEVMGREKGFIALDVGLAAGAEAILIPEIKYNTDKLVREVRVGQERGKESFIFVVAEGAGDVYALAKELQIKLNIEVRITILGHVQRGGAPTALSRGLACKLGAAAVEALLKGKSGYMIGVVSEKIIFRQIAQIYRTVKKVDLKQLQLANMLAS